MVVKNLLVTLWYSSLFKIIGFGWCSVCLGMVKWAESPKMLVYL